MHRRLQRFDAWRTESGEWRTITDEATSALWSILAYLRWHAPTLIAQDPEAAAFVDADAYLASRPVVSAIDDELARRGATPRGAALLTLRAMGLAPWELPRPSVRRGRRSVP